MKFINDLTDLVFIEDSPEKSDIIFIPGGSYGVLAQTAAHLYRQNFAPLILPSGKYSKTTGYFGGSKDSPPIFPHRKFTTEWEFLKDILVNEGVKTSHILKEDQATFTYENAIYSKQVTDRLGLTVKKAIICCQAYHARRCRIYYEILYPDTQFFICPTVTQGISKTTWYTDPIKTDIVLDEIARLGNQFHNIVRQYSI